MNCLWVSHLRARSWNCSAAVGEAVWVPSFCHGIQATSQHVTVRLSQCLLITDFLFSKGITWNLQGMRFLVSFGAGPQQGQNVYIYYPCVCFRRLKISAILSHDHLCRESHKKYMWKNCFKTFSEVLLQATCFPLSRKNGKTLAILESKHSWLKASGFLEFCWTCNKDGNFVYEKI